MTSRMPHRSRDHRRPKVPREVLESKVLREILIMDPDGKQIEPVAFNTFDECPFPGGVLDEVRACFHKTTTLLVWAYLFLGINLRLDANSYSVPTRKLDRPRAVRCHTCCCKMLDSSSWCRFAGKLQFSDSSCLVPDGRLPRPA